MTRTATKKTATTGMAVAAMNAMTTVPTSMTVELRPGPDQEGQVVSTSGDVTVLTVRGSWEFVERLTNIW